MKIDEQLLGGYIDEALALHEAGKSYAEIRTHLKTQLDDNTIAYIIRLADELIMEETRIKAEYKKAMFRTYLGVAFTAFSLVLFYNIFFIQNLPSYKRVVVLVPVVVSGYFLIKSYFEAMRWKNTVPEVDDSKLKIDRKKKK